MKFIKFAFFFVLTVLVQREILAQDWISYQSQQQINDLVDTGDELYLATDAGLVVVNKATLNTTVFNKANSNLTNNHIQSITLSADGNAYIGTYDVILSRFDGNNFEEMTSPNLPELDQFTELYDFKIAPNGDFWLGTNDGIFHRQGQTWTLYDQDELGPELFDIWDIEINAAGEVFIASVELYKFANGLWSNITEGTTLQNYNSADLFTSSTGDMFMAGHLDQINRFDGLEWESYDIDFNGSEVIKFTEDVEGNIYFNTQRDGIFKLIDDNFVQQMDAQTEAFNDLTAYFYIDAQNNRWLNSNIHLSVNRNEDIESTLISQHTLESNYIRSIYLGENDHLYFLNYSSDHFSVLDTDGNWSFFPKPSIAELDESLIDILVVADNDIWMLSSNGLYHYDGNDWTFNNLMIGGSLRMDSQGKIYVGSYDKILILDNGTMSEINPDNSSLSNLIISGLGIDANDNLWIASFDWDGNAAIQNLSTDGTWTTYTNTEYPVIERPVGDFHFDIDGNVWVPNDLVGAIKFDGTEFSNPFIGNIDQMANYSANAIQGDGTGKIYFSHQYGVTTLLDGEWEDLLIQDIPPVATSANTTIQFDNDGTLWWANDRLGVFSYTPEIATSIDHNFNTDPQFSLFPNPAGSYVILDATNPKNSIASLFIYNNLGQLTSSLDLGELPAGTFQQRIDVSNFPKGFYTIQLRINGQSSTRSLIVH